MPAQLAAPVPVEHLPLRRVLPASLMGSLDTVHDMLTVKRAGVPLLAIVTTPREVRYAVLGDVRPKPPAGLPIAGLVAIEAERVRRRPPMQQGCGMPL